MTPVEKNNVRLEAGLGKLKSRLAATRKDHTAPWLTWSRRCAALEATLPSLSRNPTNVERLAPGQVDHCCDAIRYAVSRADTIYAIAQSSWRLW